MTSDEIDKMEAGRLLDARIAEVVMELPNVGWYRRTSSHSQGMQPCAPDDFTPDYPEWKASLYWWHESMHARAVPAFSSDITAAWQVLEHLDHGFYVRRQGKQFPYYCVINDANGQGGDVWVSAPTAALAICKAALKIVKGHPQ